MWVYAQNKVTAEKTYKVKQNTLETENGPVQM